MTGRKQTPALDHSVLEAATREVAAIAASEKVSIAIAGGYALQFYGSPRFTGDIDIIADRELGMPVISMLSFGGFRTKTENGVPTDIIVRNDDYAELFEEALNRAQRDPELPAPIVSLEYLAAMKMVAGRKKDELDLEWMATETEIDLAKATDIIKRHLGRYAAHEFETIVKEARWMAKQDR